MRVTVCAKYFRHGGGAQTFLLAFVRFLQARGHEVTVLALEGEPMEGVTVRSVGRPRFCPRVLRDFLHGRRLALELERRGSDVSFGEQKMWGCNVLRPGGGAQRALEQQYIDSHQSGRLLLRLLRLFSLKRVSRLCAEGRAYRDPALRCVIANSHTAREWLLRDYPHIADRVSVVYNGADTDRFSPGHTERRRAEVHRELGLDPAAITALFVANDFRLKGLREALHGLKLARRYDSGFRLQLIVVGKGRIGRYRRIARRCGLEDVVRFAGGTREPERFYAAGDVLLFPSFYDPCANVTLEALAAGLPVITTVHNGAHELLTHDVDGWVLPDPRDIASMADALLELRDPDRRAELKSAARAKALQHPIQDKLAEITYLLESAAPV